MADRPAQALSGLARAYAGLNSEQKEAVDSAIDTAVLAGPGSGKTDTLAVKAGIALRATRAPRGVACITYTRAAATEIRERVGGLGIQPERRFITSTVHGFCLNQVIKPHAELVGETELAARQIVGAKRSRQLLQEARNQTGGWLRDLDLMVMRRAVAAEEDLTAQFSEEQISVMSRYEELLRDSSLIDFDGLVHEALRLLQTHPRVVDLCVARYPWILIDEYQDLGGPLHCIVDALRTAGGATFFAVGDPDQTILQFTGADSKYLEGLKDDGFHEVRLTTNYRSGSSMIEAAESVLETPRHYKPNPNRTDPGDVQLHPVEGGLRAQAEFAVTHLLPGLDRAGIERHEVAFLYPRQGPVLSSVQSTLKAAGIAFSLERDPRFPALGEIVGWLQRCAQWSLSEWHQRQGRFRPLVDQLREYFVAAHHAAGQTWLSSAEVLLPLLERPLPQDMLLRDWLSYFAGALTLEEVLAGSSELAQDGEALAELMEIDSTYANLPLADFAGTVRRLGSVVVTNYHSAKGRQFDAVILVGLQDGVVPVAWERNGRWRYGSIDHERKLFYVAMTRARQSIALLWSDGTRSCGPMGPRSRFIDRLV